MSKQFKVPVNLVQLTTDPSTATAGDIYFNSASSLIRFYSGTEWLDIGSGTGGGGGTINHTHDYDGSVIVGAGGDLVTTATFGSGIPNNSNGQDGDVYVDISNLNVYVKSSGSWGSPTSINTYTIEEIDSLLNTKSDTGHTHLVSDLSDITVTSTEINYLSGTTDNVQLQIDTLATNLSNTLGDYVPLADVGQPDGVAAVDSDGNILVLDGAGIKFSDNTIQTTAFNTSGFATASELSDVEVLALAGL